MQEAYEQNLNKESSEINWPNESEILNILANSLYKQGNLKRALVINDKLIKIGKLNLKIFYFQLHHIQMQQIIQNCNKNLFYILFKLN